MSIDLKNNTTETSVLVTRFRSGDEKAFEQLYNKYCKGMYNASLRICGCAADAEDVVQESFVAAFKALNELKKEPVFGPWLRSIIINRSIDCVRRKKKNLVLIDVSEIEEPEYEPESEEPEYTIEDVQTALQELPDGYRLVLTLFVFENLGHRDIAEKLNISEGTSKSQYARAKKKLITTILQNHTQHAR